MILFKYRFTSVTFYVVGGGKKIFWFILTIAALGLLIAHLYYLTNNFLKFETSTEVTVEPAKILEFPGKTKLIFIFPVYSSIVMWVWKRSWHERKS